MIKQPFQAMGLAIGVSVLSASAFSQASWQTLKDKTGSCQLSVPGNWYVSQAGHAASPENMGTTLIEGRVAYHPFHFSAGELKVLNIDTVFENSAQRVFYVGKSGGTPISLIYHVEAPGRTQVCIAEISTTPSYSQDEIKKIAATLAAVK